MTAFGLAWWLLAGLVTWALSITVLALLCVLDGGLVADDETSEVLDHLDQEQRIREGRQP